MSIIKDLKSPTLKILINANIIRKKVEAKLSVILGSGEYRYRVVDGWAKLPDNWTFMDVAAVAVDSKDQVFVFNRGEHPMVVFVRNGNFLREWGKGLFTRAHGLHIGPDDMLYCRMTATIQ